MPYIVEVHQDGERIGYVGEVDSSPIVPPTADSPAWISMSHTQVPGLADALRYDKKAEAEIIAKLYRRSADGRDLTFHVVEEDQGI